MVASENDAKLTPDGTPSYELEPSPAEMQQMLMEVGRRTAEFITSLAEQPAQASEPPEGEWPPLPPPETGMPLEEILDRLFQEVVPFSFNTAGPGYLAYVPGGGLYTAALAEFLAALVNRYAGVWIAAPRAVELESQTLRWLAELMGFPPGALGVFTTGGSLSNLVALVAAREKYLGERLYTGTAYFSEEAHHSMVKAARIAGLPPRNCRTVMVDDAFRMRLDHLEDEIAADRRRGLTPFFLCGSAGTVNTGAVDPLKRLGELAKEENLWFHVDGAYGAVFRLVPELAPVLSGMERADSLSIDPHKGFFLPYGTGALLVQDIDTLRTAFHTTASYMPPYQQDPRRVDFCEVSPELSRAWRGVRLWLPFMLHGVGAFRRALQEKRDLAVLAWERLRAEPDVEIAAPPELSLFAFRRRFQNCDLEEENRRNRELLERINARNRIMLTGTEISGRYYLRICVLHLRTHAPVMEEGLTIILDALRGGRAPADGC